MRYITGVAIIILLIGCAAHQETVIQQADRSYILFAGDLRNVTVQIDNGAPFPLDESRNKTYQVRPGKHIIKAFRKGEIIVNRILFLDNQVTTEVLIP